jgi:hypothetical protein
VGSSISSSNDNLLKSQITQKVAKKKLYISFFSMGVIYDCKMLITLATESLETTSQHSKFLYWCILQCLKLEQKLSHCIHAVAIITYLSTTVNYSRNLSTLAQCDERLFFGVLCWGLIIDTSFSSQLTIGS